jgi:hypothetical protein
VRSVRLWPPILLRAEYIHIGPLLHACCSGQLWPHACTMYAMQCLAMHAVALSTMCKMGTVPCFSAMQYQDGACYSHADCRGSGEV